MKTVAKSTLINYAEELMVSIKHGGHPSIFEYDGAVHFDSNASVHGQHELMYNEREKCEILVDEEVLHDAMCELQYETYDELSAKKEAKLLAKIVELITKMLVRESYTVVDDSAYDNLIGVNEAAKLWDFSADRIKRFCQDGEIIARRIGRDWVIIKNQPAPERRRKEKMFDSFDDALDYINERVDFRDAEGVTVYANLDEMIKANAAGDSEDELADSKDDIENNIANVGEDLRRLSAGFIVYDYESREYQFLRSLKKKDVDNFIDDIR